jgi:hypothetical protein
MRWYSCKQGMQGWDHQCELWAGHSSSDYNDFVGGDAACYNRFVAGNCLQQHYNMVLTTAYNSH